VISPFAKRILSIGFWVVFSKEILGWFVLRLYGIIAIILALIVTIFPVGTSVFLIILIEMAFLIDGISRVVHGFGDNESRGCSRGFSIGVGMIMIVTGIPGRRVGIRL
jgi:uncharacterized membrane protein HdeD (DUF308 family)